MLAVEKIVTSKLYEPGVNKRVFIIDQHIGMVIIEYIEISSLSTLGDPFKILRYLLLDLFIIFCILFLISLVIFTFYIKYMI